MADNNLVWPCVYLIEVGPNAGAAPGGIGGEVTRRAHAHLEGIGMGTLVPRSASLRPISKLVYVLSYQVNGSGKRA